MPTLILESIVAGVVWKVEKRVGERVAAGEVVMILESMKMEIPLESPVAGVVQQLHVDEGERVDEGMPVAVIAS